MSGLGTLRSLIGDGDRTARRKDDFYATPDQAIDALLERELFVGEVWEPACGDGAISEKLKSRGYQVYSTDLIDRDYGDDHFDFLNSLRPADNIVTNPPFNIGTEFTLHALRLASRKVCIFNKLTFLEGKERRDKLYSQRNLRSVHVFSERVTFPKAGQKSSGMLAFAWFVFDKGYYGYPRIEFI